MKSLVQSLNKMSFLEWWPSGSNTSDGKRRSSIEVAPRIAGVPSVVPQSDLYDLCLEMKWEEAIRYCQQYPVDASYQDGDNYETPLYLACQNQPTIEVILTLLEANPSATTTRSRMNCDIPLHIACKYNASIDVIRALVQVNPGTACQPTKWGCTPVQALWDGHKEPGINSSGEEAASIASSESAPFENDHKSSFWEKMDVLLEAVALHRQVQEGQSTDYLFIVHAAVSLGSSACPYEVLQYCIQKYPDQVRMRDRKGQLPLHIAVQPVGIYVTIADNNSHINSFCHWSARSKRVRPQEGLVISLLLNLYPESARLTDPCEPCGRYPLHTALSNKHGWGDGSIKALVEHAPEIVQMPDPIDHLYPFLMTKNNTVVDVNTSFALLRMHPTAVVS